MKWKAVAKMKGGHTVDGKDPAPVGNYWIILDIIGTCKSPVNDGIVINGINRLPIGADWCGISSVYA